MDFADQASEEEYLRETQAAQEAESLEPDDEAPYGYTIDRATGERRPKKKAGRPSGTTETREPREPKEPKTEDRAPGEAPKGRLKRRAPKPEPDYPPFRAGPIAKGMNALYARLGKVVRVMDPEIGQALVDITRKEFPDDVTVGEAWEEVAKTNPRIRAFLMKMITGGAWGQLFMAHLPIFMAILLKPAIISKVPFGGLISSLSEEEPDGTTSMPGNMNQADIQEAAGMFATQMSNAGMNFPPEMVEQAMKMFGG